MDDEDLRDQLRRIDPAATPSPLRPTEIDRLLEDTMTQDPSGTSPTAHPRPRLPLLAAVAAVVLLLGVGGVVLLNGDDDPPPVAADRPSTPPVEPTDEPTEPATPAGPTQLTAPAPVAGRCAVPTAELLGKATEAFDGVVDQIEDDQVTLTPSTVYAGDLADEVVVTAAPEAMTALVGAVDFQVGERYLISAVDGQVTVCGFSGPYGADLEQLYVGAFGA